MQQAPPGRREDRQHHWHGVRVAAMLIAFASVTAAGPSAAAAGSEPAQPRLARHEPSRLLKPPDDVSSARRPARQRLRIEVRRQFWTDEPGTVYGYPPGNYIVGAYGILYGPYPIRPARSPVLVDDWFSP